MTYHLPRVAYWAENHSVAHYATTIYRQVGNPPLHGSCMKSHGRSDAARKPPGTGASQLVSTLDLRYLFINGVKNYIYNFPNIYVENGNAFLERGVNFLARRLGVEINAECISEGGGEFQLRSATSYVTSYMLSYVVLMCPMIVFWCEDMSLHARTPVIRESVLYVVGWMSILELITMFSYHGQTAKDQHMSRPGGYER